MKKAVISMTGGLSAVMEDDWDHIRHSEALTIKEKNDLLGKQIKEWQQEKRRLADLEWENRQLSKQVLKLKKQVKSFRKSKRTLSMFLFWMASAHKLER